MSNLVWRQIQDGPPHDGQECLTKSKHGIIQGSYNAADAEFEGYYWRDMTWWATEWVPIEEAT